MKSPIIQSLISFLSRLLDPLDHLAWWYANKVSDDYYRDGSGRAAIQRIGFVMRILTRRGTIARMKMVLGAKTRSPEKWNQLWNSYAYEVGRSLMEAVMLSKQPYARLPEMITLKGEHHLREALAQNRGVMLFLSHLGAMATVPASLGTRDYDLTITGNRCPRPYFEDMFRKLIAGGDIKRLVLAENLPLRAAETFRRNGIFAAFFDHAVGRKHIVWMPFGQAEIGVSIAPAFMALRCDAPILGVRHYRLSDYQYEIEIGPPLPIPDKSIALRERAVAVTRHAIDWLARDIATRPDHWWFWDYAGIRPSELPVQAEPAATARQEAGAYS